MTTLTIFAGAFVTVFALGFQSLNVNGGHHGAAFLTSFVIGLGNLVVLKHVPAGDALAVAAYLIGGPFGIVASMYAHRKWMRKR